MSFLHAFTETLIHSIWQSCLLVLCYVLINKLINKIHPIQKRNFLFSLLLLQILLSIFTFIGFYWGGFVQVFQAVIYQYFATNYLYKYLDIVFYFYLIVVSIRFAALFLQWNTFKNNYATSLTRPSPEYKLFTELKTYQFGIKRAVTLWYCNKIQAPITFGFLRPIILLPFSLVNAITQQEAEAIILHELTHIKNKDYLLNWMMVGMEIVYFFNPFVKIIIEKIKLEREKNCDVQVLNFEYDELMYAQTLLKIAKNNTQTTSFQLGAVKSTSQLLKRIGFFCESENLRFKYINTNIITLLLVPIFVMSTTLFLPIAQKARKATAAPNNIYVNEKTRSLNTRSAEIKPLEKRKVFVQGYKLPSIKTDIKRSVDETVLNYPMLSDNTNYQFASLKETADSIKEFIYNVETNEGQLTQSYKLINIKGQWVLQPMWMMIETNAGNIQKLQIDSLLNRMDSIQ